MKLRRQILLKRRSRELDMGNMGNMGSMGNMGNLGNMGNIPTAPPFEARTDL